MVDGRLAAIRQNILLLVISLAVAVALAEVALRLVLPAPIVWKYPQESYVFDPEIGHWLKPGQQAFTHDKEVVTNSAGIRDQDYAPKAPEGVFRILALGDSQTFGNGLELGDTWPKQLESRLNRKSTGIQYEVLNSGLPGSDTWQHEIILRRMLAKYNPDATVLAFYPNDIVKSFIPNPEIETERDPFKSRIVYQLKRSALLLSLRTALDSIQQKVSPDENLLQHQALLMGESSAAIDERWDQVDRSLGAMKRVVNAGRGTFVLAALPRRDQVDGTMPAEAYNKRLQAIVDKHQVPFINMLEPLKQSFEKHNKRLFIPWDGHNSAIANSVIAREIGEELGI